MSFHNTSSPMASPNVAYLQYPVYNPSTYPTNASPESLSPPSPAFPSSSYPEHFAFQQAQGSASMQRASAHFTAGTIPVPSSLSSSHQEELEQEVRYLRRRVRELESMNQPGRPRIRTPQELASEHGYGHPTSASSSSSLLCGLPSPLPTPSPQSENFRASWHARTEARVRQFCSANRAGNALCAWHDSRRERRTYPPRMAPGGYLNCGCTNEEALFEESLSRHGVGSYHPGETVRMDPALRNPLLQLLQRRYGYKDGDFERDPNTGEWLEGEGHSLWEQRAQAGASTVRKRGDFDRR